MDNAYPDPRQYLVSGSYKSVMGPGKHGLSDLELALMGYVSSSPNQIEIEGKTKPAASYDQLKRLVFEYLKINKEDSEIKGIINRSIGMLQRFYAIGLHSSLVGRVHSLVNNYNSLARKKISSIPYEKFNPSELSKVNFGTNPFNTYFKNKIKNLVRSGMLVKKRHGRNWYLVMHPDLRVA